MMIENLFSQLDTLVPFLGLANEEIFSKIHDENQEWFTEQQRKSLPDTFNSYKNQVSVSAFLLGYSYFEVFIADLAKKILLSRPVLLPKDKNLTYGEVVDAQEYNILLERLVEKQVFSVMYSSVEKISEYYEKNLHITWPNYCNEYSIEKAALIRNCYMHNGGIVDARLHNKFGLEIGSKIFLSPSEVHGYGITVRQIAHEIYNQAKIKHLQSRT
ncbi:MAG: hypothetical protein KDC43_28485 [Saprospiraceae bacterium]|nr:hypothetical protein [Saprospiraceae bacterium]